MQVSVALAVGALAALAVALLGGGSWFGLMAVGLAAAGIVALLRDWWSDRSRARVTASGSPSPESDPVPPYNADALSPDISTNPDGPSSDARAD